MENNIFKASIIYDSISNLTFTDYDIFYLKPYNNFTLGNLNVQYFKTNKIYVYKKGKVIGDDFAKIMCKNVVKQTVCTCFAKVL
jgi:hypothetical protein